jgi:NADH-quinone oxidoreductase subunit J
MLTLLVLPAAVAIVASVLAVTRANPIHALLYLIVSLLAVAAFFYVIGAPFIAALEVIIYAGAITVLFLFAVMMLHGGGERDARERVWQRPRARWGPLALAALIGAELLYVVAGIDPATAPHARLVTSKEVSLAMFGPYSLGVELASFLLLAGMVGAFHIGRRSPRRAGGEDPRADAEEAGR